MIQKKNLSKNSNIIASQVQIRSALNDLIKIIDLFHQIPIKIGGNELVFSTFVPDNCPEYTTIGIQVLIRDSDCTIKILEKKTEKNNSAEKIHECDMIRGILKK